MENPCFFLAEKRTKNPLSEGKNRGFLFNDEKVHKIWAEKPAKITKSRKTLKNILTNRAKCC